MEDTKVLDKNEEKKTKTPKEITILVLKIVGNVIFYGVLILLFIISIANINAGGSKGLPNIFGKGFLTVEDTKSMEAKIDFTITSSSKSTYSDAQKQYLAEQGVLSADGTYSLDYTKFKFRGFSTHDLVTVDLLNADQKKHLSIGDVITYYDVTQEIIVSHRIVYLDVDTDGNIVDYVTMGDTTVYGTKDVFSGNQSGIDNDGNNAFQYYTIMADSEYIYGKVTSIVYGGGDVAKNIKANWLIYFVIPVAMVLLVEMFFVYKNFVAYRNEKKGVTKDGKIVATNSEIDLEAERERMKQELLAELRASGAVKEDTATKEVKEDIQADNTEVEENGTDTEEESDTNNDLEEDSSNKDEE